MLVDIQTCQIHTWRWDFYTRKSTQQNGQARLAVLKMWGWWCEGILHNIGTQGQSWSMTIYTRELLRPITLTNNYWQVSSPFWIPVTTFCHLCMTSKIPRTKFPCLNLVVINFWPWTLFIVKSHLLFLSDPASMCSLFMYSLPCCVFHLHLVYPCPCTYCTSDFPD